MAKLINADETVKAIIKRFGIGNERYLLPSERAIVDVIESMPTVDAVPIDWIEEWYCTVKTNISWRRLMNCEM